MHSIYLVQRATIDRPLFGIYSSLRLSHAVKFDYMGSSEFEWGALPASFRRIEAAGSPFVMRTVEAITNKVGGKQRPLIVWSTFSDEDFKLYVDQLIHLRNGKRHTKEYTGFDVGFIKSKFNNPDFWWDIENDVMFGFDNEFMPRVGEHVASSLKFMNDQK